MREVVYAVFFFEYALALFNAAVMGSSFSSDVTTARKWSFPLDARVETPSILFPRGTASSHETGKELKESIDSFVAAGLSPIFGFAQPNSKTIDAVIAVEFNICFNLIVMP
jgi:hypothetical protein